MMRRATTVILLNAALVATLGSGPVAAAEIVAKDAGARVEKIGEGVYAILHERATEDWPHGNTGVIVGDEAVLVIDSTYLPARAEADIALIRSLTDKPVRYLLNTHWHGDHTHGNGVYRDAFPGLAILGQRDNRAWIDLNLTKLPRGALATGSYNRKTLAELEAKLAQGLEADGKALSAEDKTDLQRNIAERQAELKELARVKAVPPNLLFDDRLDLDLGPGRRIELRNRGRANSPNDVTVYLPEQRILFTGDILVSTLPYVGGSYPGPWIQVLRELEALPVQALVPGHGAVQADHTYTRTVREVFETTQARIEALYREGKNLTQAKEQVDIADLRNRFRNRRGELHSPELWKEWSTVLVARMVQCVHGYEC